jgi:DNA-binding Lrp family transcriptional regulator
MNVKKRKLTNTEMRLISELMKNSRRSDRQLAKALSVSQPTVTRTMAKLEKEGMIKEYTIVPDFTKLGYTLLAVTFVKLKESLTPDQTAKARDPARKSLRENYDEVFMLERGIGIDSNGVFLSIHKDYSSYLDFKKWLNQFEFLQISNIESFLVNLEDEIHYRPLTFATLAKHILRLQEADQKRS